MTDHLAENRNPVVDHKKAKEALGMECVEDLH